MMGQNADKDWEEQQILHTSHHLMNETLSYIVNGTNQTIHISPEVFYQIIKEQKRDRNLPLSTEIILIVVYSFLIVAGLLTNLLVSFVVARRRQMHTARNLYIVNLTISDISMCLICMPFTLVIIVRTQWTLGPLLCKLVNVLQGTNIMVSIGTITVIALDRYYTICRRSASTQRRVVLSIIVIWCLSLLASMPLFAFQGLEPVYVHHLVLYEVCIEQWPSQSLRVAYGVALLLVMAVIPPLVVATVHARIAKHLYSHAKTQKDAARARREIERNRRTTTLLSGIVVIFAVSWLPLSIFSLASDVLMPYSATDSNATFNMLITLSFVHIIAMTSAITNPIVYGWLNSNIRREFLALLPEACAARFRRDTVERADGNENETQRTQINLNTTDDKERKESVGLLVSVSKKSIIGNHENVQNSTHL